MMGEVGVWGLEVDGQVGGTASSGALLEIYMG